MPDANAIAAAAMPLTDYRIRLGGNAGNRIADRRGPHRTPTEEDFATLTGNPCRDRSCCFARGGVNTSDRAVALIKNPHRASANRKEAGPRTHRNLIGNLVSCRVDADECVVCIRGYPEGTVRKRRIE